MSRAVEFKFDMGDKVKTKHDPPIVGEVVAFHLDKDEVRWVEIEYVSSGGLKMHFVRERDLQPAT